MKKLALLLLVSGLLGTIHGQTILLDNFNSGAASGAVVSNTTWVGQVTQNATTLTVGGAAKDENGWGATFSALNLSGASFIDITAQLDSGNVAPTFSVQFLDSNLNSQVFTVATSSFLVSSLSTVSIAISSWGAVDSTQITDWNIGGGGVGTVALRMTFDNLALSANAIPEPSTYALLIGFATLGLVVRRRVQHAQPVS